MYRLLPLLPPRLLPVPRALSPDAPSSAAAAARFHSTGLLCRTIAELARRGGGGGCSSWPAVESSPVEVRRFGTAPLPPEALAATRSAPDTAERAAAAGEVGCSKSRSVAASASMDAAPLLRRRATSRSEEPAPSPPLARRGTRSEPSGGGARSPPAGPPDARRCGEDARPAVTAAATTAFSCCLASGAAAGRTEGESAAAAFTAAMLQRRTGGATMAPVLSIEESTRDCPASAGLRLSSPEAAFAFASAAAAAAAMSAKPPDLPLDGALARRTLPATADP